MFRKFAIGIAIGSLTAGSALAADLYVPAEPPAAPVATMSEPGIDWTGFYAGVIGGYGAGDMQTTNGTGNTTINPNGAIAGVTAGTNYQIGSMVLGVEGDVGWSGQSGTATCAGGGTCSADLDWVGSVRGRVGYAFDPMLVYGTGGVAMTQANTSVSPAVGGTTGTNSDTYVGWTVGAGVETALTQQVSAKLEYNYSDFGSRTAPVNTLDSTATTTSLTSHAVKLGLNYRF